MKLIVMSTLTFKQILLSFLIFFLSFVQIIYCSESLSPFKQKYTYFEHFI